MAECVCLKERIWEIEAAILSAEVRKQKSLRPAEDFHTLAAFAMSGNAGLFDLIGRSKPGTTAAFITLPASFEK